MISSILVSNRNRREIRSFFRNSVGASLFCLIFSIIYYRFSHGVHSPFMTCLFAWPLLLSALPAGICLLVRFLPGPSVLSSLLWATGTAAVTVSSMLRGIFEIAGNSSVYQPYLMAAGFAFLAAGFAAYLAGILISEKNRSF